MYKKCSKCKEVKPTELFTRHKKSKDGFSSACKECDNRDRRLAREANPQAFYARVKVYRDRNKENISKLKKRHYLKRKSHILAKQKRYQDANREKYLEYQRLIYKNNRSEYIARARARQSKLGLATLSSVFKDKCNEIYKQCSIQSKVDGIEYQVDHIIPLNHPDICGLHVPWNLQILSKEYNKRKKNKFDGTIDNNGWKEAYVA
jgi:5-methylcytosine-specific restriction endonuclease McrA